MKSIIHFIIFLFFLTNHLTAQTNSPKNSSERIAGFGSSVCNGTGDMTNNGGYIGQLKKLMEAKGWEVVSVSRGGDNTGTIQERFDKDENIRTSNKEIRPDQYLVQAKPHFVIIGLSLANEGILNEKKEIRDSAYNRFANGLFNLITKCRNKGYQVAVAGCYSNNQFEVNHYELTKRMNILQNGLGVPLFNFLGTIDDGEGHWVNGFFNDDWHPSYGGHKEMFYAIVTSVFEAIKRGKAIPVFANSGNYALTEETADPALSYIPEDTVHSFSVSFAIRGAGNGIPASVSGKSGVLNFIDHSMKSDSLKTFEVIAGTSNYNGKLSITDGIVEYKSNYGCIKTNEKIDTSIWQKITITHITSKGETKLYIANKLIGSCSERVIPTEFYFGIKGKTGIKDILVYRSSLNKDEVDEIVNGNLIHSSLEVYAPLNDLKFETGAPVENKACSLSDLKITGKILRQE